MNKKIKVLSICTSDSSGGAARAAYRIHLAVKNYNIDSRLFVKEKKTKDEDVISLDAFAPNNPFFRLFNWLRNKVLNKWQHFIWRLYPNRSAYYMSDLLATDIHRALHKIDFDIIHLHWINLRFFPLSKLPKNKPIVWTLHDSWPFCGICHYFLDCNKYVSGCGACPHLNSSRDQDLSRWVWTIKRNIYKNLDLHIVSPSRWLSGCASQSLLFKEAPISVIPNCLDINVFKPLPDNDILAEIKAIKNRFIGKSIILFGAVNACKDKIKGASLLLEALAYLKNKGYSNQLGVIVFGSQNPLEGIPSGIMSYNAGYLTNTEELVSLYNIASVVVVPSITEVFGQVATEAMSCGKPVVAFRCTGIQDVVCDDSGYLAEPFDSEDFANGILWCLKNNVDGHLSIAARNRVVKCYAPSVVGKLYSTIYQELVNR